DATADLCTGGGPCEDATVTFGGIPLLTLASGEDQNIDCATALDVVIVSGAIEIQKDGTYTPSTPINGRTSYGKFPNHSIEWSGSQYINRDIFVGTDWITTNAPANPWSGVWVEFIGGSPISDNVEQATIGSFCHVDDDCTFNLIVNYDGTEQGRFDDFDPNGVDDLNINIEQA
ncbi:MAG TPA: hypothetical protein PK735_14515, partial [Flavobacteriales bacterium]|nr:hypothetical protein [Flavobacteriales bacterium]